MGRGRGWFWRSRWQILRNRRFQKFVLVRVGVTLVAYTAAVQLLPGYAPWLWVAVSFISACVATAVVPFDQQDHIPGLYTIVLTDPGPRVPDVVRELVVWCGMSHRTARRQCDEVPATFEAGNTVEEAHDIVLRLRNAGAAAELAV